MNTNLQAYSGVMMVAGRGGDLLNGIVLLGAMNDAAPVFIEPDAQPSESPRDAHAYAVWEPSA